MVKTRVTKPRIVKPSRVAPHAKEFFLSFVSENKSRFDSVLERQLRQENPLIARGGSSVKTTTQALIEFCLRGGKRIRPAFVWIGSLCVSGRPNVEALDQAGAALELLHNYFLVHDDWMDGDLLRRGGPSVHATLRERFASKTHGDAAAILAGDWGAAVATRWMATLPLANSRMAPALTTFSEMQLYAVTGQIRDLLATDDRPELTYELKTASYTVNGPLQLGAVIGGASPSARAALEAFAIPIGIAFQLKDDLIGVFSPETVTGKPFASDLKQGKRTVLLLEGLRRASPTDRRFLNRTIGRADASVRDLTRVARYLDECGAKSSVEKRIARFYRRSLAALESSSLRADGKTLLRSAATALISRGS